MTWGIYVHVPWCVARCPYCAFAVVPGRPPPDPRPWLERVLREHESRRPAFPGQPGTVYFGGGTPSRLPPAAFRELIEAFGPAAGAEITAEANPEDVTDRWLEEALEAGIRRLSLGVQTFDPAVAKRLGRARSSAAAEAVLDRVARRMPTFSVDLIFAVPGEPERRLDEDLRRTLGAGTPHVSLYGLTFEDGTRFERARRGGRLSPVDDDRWRRDYDRLVAALSGAGLDRYEVSNFAREGHRSAHNRLYWTDRPYLGLGPSAHGYAPDGRRWVNHADLETWLRAADASAHQERPGPREAAIDLLVSALRSVEGVDLDHLRRRTGLSPSAQAVRALERGGLVQVLEARLVLTDAGFPLCDAVVARLADQLSEA